MARAPGTAATNPHVVASCVLSRRRAARQRPRSAALRRRRFPPDLGLGRENRRDFRGHV